MAKHEFALMTNTPQEERYDCYEPEKYECLVAVDDDDIEPLLPLFEGIPCYCHTRLITTTNLVYCGITLIPPQSAKYFVEIFEQQNKGQYDAVIALFRLAEKQQKYIIHFGL